MYPVCYRTGIIDTIGMCVRNTDTILGKPLVASVTKFINVLDSNEVDEQERVKESSWVVTKEE